MVTVPEAGDADAWRGPHEDVHEARAEDRGTTHRDQSVIHVSATSVMFGKMGVGWRK